MQQFHTNQYKHNNAHKRIIAKIIIKRKKILNVCGDCKVIKKINWSSSQAVTKM